MRQPEKPQPGQSYRRPFRARDRTAYEQNLPLRIGNGLVEHVTRYGYNGKEGAWTQVIVGLEQTPTTSSLTFTVPTVIAEQIVEDAERDGAHLNSHIRTLHASYRYGQGRVPVRITTEQYHAADAIAAARNMPTATLLDELFAAALTGLIEGSKP